MAFSSVLNAYSTLLGCSNKELAERCGISMSALSRYRNGKRVPRAGSDAIGKLSEGIAALAAERGVDAAISSAAVRDALSSALEKGRPLGPSFSDRIDSLMRLVGLRNSELAKALKLDSSYVSRIRRGEREPNDKRHFAEVLAQMAAVRSMRDGMVADVLDLVGAADAVGKWEVFDVDGATGLSHTIRRWLLGNHVIESDVAMLDELFADLDAGYYEEVLAGPHEDAFSAACPVKAEPSAQFLAGDGFTWRAEMLFLENAAACGARHIYLSSDMPALETEFIPEMLARYQRALLGLIDRGCHITVIHSTDRPFHDSIVGMRTWIPLYMTGEVTSLYMEGAGNRLFCHVNNVCECCVMASEAVRGHEEDGRYYFSTLPDDLAYYRKKIDFMLEKSSTLLEIYHMGDPEHRAKFERDEAERRANGRGREISAGRYSNLRITTYAGDCVVVALDRGPGFRFVVRQPKMRYVVSQMS